jgi:hypothetical protein
MSFTSRTRAATSCRACSFVPNGVAFASPSSCRVFFAVSACLLEIDDCCCRFCFDVLRLKCKGTVRLALLPVMRSVPADNQCKQTLVHVHVMAIVSEGCVSQVFSGYLAHQENSTHVFSHACMGQEHSAWAQDFNQSRDVVVEHLQHQHCCFHVLRFRFEHPVCDLPLPREGKSNCCAERR